jgi:hypothetical protein
MKARKRLRRPNSAAQYGLSGVALMYCRHLYANPKRVTRDFVRVKQVVAHRPQARHASVAFVTGVLDPVGDSAAFHTLIVPARGGAAMPDYSAAARVGVRAAASTAAASLATRVPSKKRGFCVPHSRTALAKVKSRKSSSVIRPSSTSS